MEIIDIHLLSTLFILNHGLFFQQGKPVATFKHHTAPITSVEWNPNDASVFAASGSDDQVTLWDLGIERDQDAGGNEEEPDVPPQLLFIHQGQKDIKEIHWHSQLQGVLITTALTGFNIFRTISV
jgi:ribosome assembly protein RRB1